MLSRSRSRYRGAESSGKASTSCWAVHAEVGCSVTLTCTMRRRSCEIRTSTKSTRPVSVETVKKSIETMAERWLARKIRHGRDGGRESCASIRETVCSDLNAQLALTVDATSAGDNHILANDRGSCLRRSEISQFPECVDGES